MIYRKNIWFSPRKIILRYAQEEDKLGEKIKEAQYKIYRETRAVAIMLLGIEKMQNREYWLQIVDPKEQTPDIRTATHMTETDRRLECQDVEVVHLESHSVEDVEDFLKRTKLSAKKSYPESTIILCAINKNIRTKRWEDISVSLAGVGKKNDIYLLGRIDPREFKYQLSRIYPKFDQIAIFDLIKEARKPARDCVRFERSTKVKDYRENTSYDPFES